MGLSGRFFKDPIYWRMQRFSEFTRLIREINRLEIRNKSKPRTVTDSKGRKRRIVPVKD